MSPDHRPVYIDLRKINLPISAWISITHRITGILVFFITTPIFLVLFAYLTNDLSSFTNTVDFFKNNLIYAFLVVLSFLILWLHLLTGLRHLLMDFKIGESLIAAKYSAIFVNNFISKGLSESLYIIEMKLSVAV